MKTRVRIKQTGTWGNNSNHLRGSWAEGEEGYIDGYADPAEDRKAIAYVVIDSHIDRFTLPKRLVMIPIDQLIII